MLTKQHTKNDTIGMGYLFNLIGLIINRYLGSLLHPEIKVNNT